MAVCQSTTSSLSPSSFSEPCISCRVLHLFCIITSAFIMTPRSVRPEANEEEPLLSAHRQSNAASHPPNLVESRTVDLSFSDEDPENPRCWNSRAKLTNVGVVAFMAIVSPLASSMFNPGIAQIAEDLQTTQQAVIATSTAYIVMLGVGPLILAPFSETFGRRKVYISCFSIFSLLQIPTALSPKVEFLIVLRAIAGFFGSVGIANGGGTISDMYAPSQRAGVFGWYLLGPLLGPTLGPLFGGLIVTRLGWRWVYGIMTIVCALNTTVGFFFLRETYAPVLLERRRAKLEAENDNINYHFDGEDDRPLSVKLRGSMARPLVIFVQPIVLTMSFYQALIFGTTFSIYTNMQDIYSKEPYGFDSEQVGLLFLFPGLGFLTSVWFLIPQIDTVFNRLTEKNKGQAMPEFRLPLANIGSILIPTSLFWFAWTVHYRTHWAISITATYFYGVGQVVVFNAIQNYYIDSFSKYAASAIAGGSVFRSLVGGVVPLFAPMLFEKVGYGWGISTFAFLAVAIAPSPLFFYHYGPRIRERFRLEL